MTMGVRVGRIMPARVTPSSEIPIDGAGACDQVHDGRLVGRPIRVKRIAGSSHILGFVIVSPSLSLAGITLMASQDTVLSVLGWLQ